MVEFWDTLKSFINSLRYYIKSQEFKTFDIDNGGTQIRDFTFLSDFVKIYLCNKFFYAQQEDYF